MGINDKGRGEKGGNENENEREKHNGNGTACVLIMYMCAWWVLNVLGVDKGDVGEAIGPYRFFHSICDASEMRRMHLIKKWDGRKADAMVSCGTNKLCPQ